MYFYYTLSLLVIVFLGPALSEGQSYFISVLSIGVVVGAMMFFAFADRKLKAVLSAGGAVALFLVATRDPSGLESLIVLWVSVFILFSAMKKKRAKPCPAKTPEK